MSRLRRPFIGLFLLLSTGCVTAHGSEPKDKAGNACDQEEEERATKHSFHRPVGRMEQVQEQSMHFPVHFC